MAYAPVGGDNENAATIETQLQRVMGPWLLLLFIVGDILLTRPYEVSMQHT